jgi:formylmethanofuran dehydrogenase subunit E
MKFTCPLRFIGSELVAIQGQEAKFDEQQGRQSVVIVENAKINSGGADTVKVSTQRI